MQKLLTGADCKIYIGNPGCGKTLVQTEEDVLPLLIAGEEVWCCYFINWNKPNFHYFAPADFEAVKDLRNVVVVYDELAQTFEPRSWEQEGSEVRRWFQLHRHRHITIIGNTQDVSLVAKTVGIVANMWRYLTISPTPILDWIFGLKRVRTEIEEVSFQQLKKMASGWELGQEVGRENKVKIGSYSREKLIHRELDEFKVERYHKYCKKCCMRQGGLIRKEDEKDVLSFSGLKNSLPELKIKEFCPKHKEEELIIRESGMYDTDYETEIKVRDRKQVWVKKITKESWVLEGTGFAPAGLK